jgi:DNA-binding beta-propeller fold protein YncE
VIAVGAGAEGVAVDPATHRVAVAVADPPALVLVDDRTGAVARRVPLPGAARHVTFADGRFLVGAETANRLLAVSPAGAVVQDVAVGDHPHDATAAAGRRVAGDERGNTLSVVGGGGATRTVPVATQPGGVTTTSGGRAIAVVSVRERVLELYDATTLRRVARVGAGIGPTHVVAAGGRLYVADTQGGALLVFQTTPELELVRRVYLPGSPYGIAVDPVRHRLWVTLTARNEVVELPAHGRPHVLRRLPTVRQPDSVAVDPADGLVLVTGRTAGVLQVIDP